MKLESHSFVGKVAIVLAVVVAVFFTVMAVDAATTISTNISTGGTLAVTDTSTFTGLTTHVAGFVSQASSTINGSLDVSGGVARQNEIWDYNSSGNIVSTTSLPIVTSSTLGVNGSTTPAFTLGVDGDIIASTTQTTSATTTLILDTSGSATGGCIQMRNSIGVTNYKIVINGTTLAAEAGTCK